MKALRSHKALALAIATAGLIVLGGSVALAGVISQQVVFPPNNAANSGAANIRIVHTVANEFDSGWHTHPGPAIVQVQAGFLKIYQGSCEPTVVQKGDTYIEIPGVPVRGVASGPVEWTTTLVIPGPFGGSPAPPAQTNLTTNPCP
jgi:quercetin dioxygenase-like cupin family protein